MKPLMVWFNLVQNNTTASLDLYAKVEDLLGVQEVTPTLYAHYLLFLQEANPTSLLDVGCGSGLFLEQMQQALGGASFEGIDLSPHMVAQAKKRGVEAFVKPLEEVEGRYEVITAVFDMVNYLCFEALSSFLTSVREHLEEGGFFLFDINTLYGFEEVAVGSFTTEDEMRFVAIESDFNQPLYEATFTLFEKEKACYRRSQEKVYQYYHTVESIVEMSGLALLSKTPLSLYELGEADKLFVVLQKK